jgi:hypothetical protein
MMQSMQSEALAHSPHGATCALYSRISMHDKEGNEQKQRAADLRVARKWRFIRECSTVFGFGHCYTPFLS